MSIIRHIPFLKQVFIYACTAFGGPTGHMGVMTKTFVQNRKDVTQDELTEIFSFCQLLPGPSSTQTITLIGYKRGGSKLAVLTLLIWLIPACLLMCGAALLLTHYKNIIDTNHAFRYIQPMAIGFLFFAIAKAMANRYKDVRFVCIVLATLVLSLLIRSPWVFPILLIIGGVVSNTGNGNTPQALERPPRIAWSNLAWFFILFAIAGLLSELARRMQWHNARLFNMFENFYRFGSLTWGGGHVLMPQMHEQFIALPIRRGVEPYLSNSDFLVGFGIMNSVPGPVFSVSSFVGAMAMQKWGLVYQLAGAAVAVIGVFLPSTLLVLFMFPIYRILKQHPIIFRALAGISAVVIGTMCAGGVTLMRDMQLNVLSLTTILLTFFLMYFTKLPAPIWVLLCLLAGLLI